MPRTATSPPPPLLETIEGTARLLGQSRSTIYKLVREGRLPCVKIGTSARIPRAAVEELVGELLADRAPTDNESPTAGQATGLSATSAGTGQDASQF